MPKSGYNKLQQWLQHNKSASDEHFLLRHDADNDKTTYVTIHGLEKADRDQRELSRSAIEKLDSSGREAPFLRELILSLVNREMWIFLRMRVNDSW